MGKENSSILELKDVSKIYRTKGRFFREEGRVVRALDHLSFKIQEGEIFGLVGESGSGKTTCGRLIVRLEEPQGGKIFLDGTEITTLKGKALKAYRRKVQMIFQDPYQSLNSQLSIFESIAEPLIIHKMGDGAARRQRVLTMLRTVGLTPPEEFINRYPHQVSGGQRQRIAIARAMILEPQFVVADEPTSMLDASYSAKIFNILLDVRAKLKVTILFITHSLAAARYLCDRIAVIYRGRLVEVGPAGEMIQNPKHPYTQALIDALPKFGHRGDAKRYDTLRVAPRQAPGTNGCAFFARCKKCHATPCGREIPSFKAVGPSHYVACHFLEPADSSLMENDQCLCGV
jgi:oligopeptide/dipeptide ABC transporter ATP-binding protein